MAISHSLNLVQGKIVSIYKQNLFANIKVIVNIIVCLEKQYSM